jgi:hypothetical protein
MSFLYQLFMPCETRVWNQQDGADEASSLPPARGRASSLPSNTFAPTIYVLSIDLLEPPLNVTSLHVIPHFAALMCKVRFPSPPSALALTQCGGRRGPCRISLSGSRTLGPGPGSSHIPCYPLHTMSPMILLAGQRFSAQRAPRPGQVGIFGDIGGHKCGKYAVTSATEPAMLQKRSRGAGCCVMALSHW